MRPPARLLARPGGGAGGLMQAGVAAAAPKDAGHFAGAADHRGSPIKIHRGRSAADPGQVISAKRMDILQDIHPKVNKIKLNKDDLSYSQERVSFYRLNPLPMLPTPDAVSRTLGALCMLTITTTNPLDYLGNPIVTEGDAVQWRIVSSNPALGESVQIVPSSSNINGGVQVVNFAPGTSNTQFVSFSTTDDKIYEPFESYSFGFRPSSGTSLNTTFASGTLRNNDRLPEITITAQKATLLENAADPAFHFDIVRSGEDLSMVTRSRLPRPWRRPSSPPPPHPRPSTGPVRSTIRSRSIRQPSPS